MWSAACESQGTVIKSAARTTISDQASQCALRDVNTSRETMPATLDRGAISSNESAFRQGGCSLTDHPANRANNVGILSSRTGGDPNKSADFEPFLVVAGAGIDPAADEQAAHEFVGAHVAAEFDQREVGFGRINVQPINLGQSTKNRRELRMNRTRARSYSA